MLPPKPAKPAGSAADRRQDCSPVPSRDVISPIDMTTVVGTVTEATREQAKPRSRRSKGRLSRLERHAAQTSRASALERAADLLQQRQARFIALLQSEGGKTLDDALSEVREAIDFCRYYAAEGRRLFGSDQPLPGPTGESNVLRLRGRGVIVAISPWNFPLAIFLGQISAALMAGNAVVAKPAEQTPLIAAEAVRLLHEAGVPASALHLVPGDGSIGAALVAHAGHCRRGLHRLDRCGAEDQPRRWRRRTARSCR